MEWIAFKSFIFGMESFPVAFAAFPEYARTNPVMIISSPMDYREAARYYQLLNALIDRPEALEHDPLLVKRLRRLREQRQRTRSASRLANR